MCNLLQAMFKDATLMPASSLAESKAAVSFGEKQSAFQVEGYFPSGAEYQETVLAEHCAAALVQVVSRLRYTDDGGELAVSSVQLLAAGADGAHLDVRQVQLTSESEALEMLVLSLRAQFSARGNLDSGTNAALELFELLLADAPDALDGITASTEGYGEDDLTLSFFDTLDNEHRLVPGQALSELAKLSLDLGWSPYAAQIAAMTSCASQSVSLAVIDAICSQG